MEPCALGYQKVEIGLETNQTPPSPDRRDVQSGLAIQHSFPRKSCLSSSGFRHRGFFFFFLSPGGKCRQNSLLQFPGQHRTQLQTDLAEGVCLTEGHSCNFSVLAGDAK